MGQFTSINHQVKYCRCAHCWSRNNGDCKHWKIQKVENVTQTENCCGIHIQKQINTHITCRSCNNITILSQITQPYTWYPKFKSIKHDLDYRYQVKDPEIYKCDKCKTKLLYNDERISDDLLQKVFNKCPTRLCEHCNQTGKHLIFKSCDNCDGTGGTTTKKCFKCKGEKSIVVGQTNVDCDKCW